MHACCVKLLVPLCQCASCAHISSSEMMIVILRETLAAVFTIAHNTANLNVFNEKRWKKQHKIKKAQKYTHIHTQSYCSSSEMHSVLLPSKIQVFERRISTDPRYQNTSTYSQSVTKKRNE